MKKINAACSRNFCVDCVFLLAINVSVDLCIIGGGVSGLAAAITAAENLKPDASIILLESESAVGGRVRSDRTPDGFTLDRGFAVFIEEYPTSKQMLDYDALELAQFLPGARVKLAGREKLAPVSDPLRRRRDILKAITSPVGSALDKIRLVPLLYTVVTKNIDELFSMEETDTLTCLREKYKFSEEFISSFLAPFLEGIYLTPLEKQSSRMFHFLFRMFTLGSASLPAGGMQSVANQLEKKATDLGVHIQFSSAVLSLKHPGKENGGEITIEVGSGDNSGGSRFLQAKSVVVATDEKISRNLLENVDGLDQIKSLPKLSQRTVGCIYYGFRSPAPLIEPILILNGEGGENRNTKDFPINNVCFPSIVQKTGYAPEGYELCCVSVLENAIKEHSGDYKSLDASARNQLSAWFPSFAGDIMDESIWVQKGVHVINNAQPGHFNEDGCANVHGGRDCTTFRGISIPPGIFVSGDHMATSTFNGALESGVNAGKAATFFLGNIL